MLTSFIYYFLGNTARVCVIFMGAAFIAGSAGADVKADTASKSEADCTLAEGGARVNVLVRHIRSLEGNLRAQVYGPSPEEFLEKGAKLVRVDVPVKAEGEQHICVPFPSSGKFTLVVMHDRNSNGKADFFSEGFGFSNNPKLGFSKPDAEDVVFDVPNGVSEVTVDLKYILGSDEQQDKRRKLKRR